MTTTTYRTPRKTAELGFQALIEKLGCGGAVAFISQYETGEGNYTVEGGNYGELPSGITKEEEVVR